jgi:hypothetical protein
VATAKLATSTAARAVGLVLELGHGYDLRDRRHAAGPVLKLGAAAIAGALPGWCSNLAATAIAALPGWCSNSRVAALALRRPRRVLERPHGTEPARRGPISRRVLPPLLRVCN